MSKKLAAFFVIAAGVLWGIISIFINRLSTYQFTSVEICFLRVLTCAVVMFLFLLVYNRKLLRFRLKDIWMFVGTGIISLTLFSYCYFTTIVNIEASIAVSLLYTSPVFILLFSALLFHESITVKKTAAIILTVLGCALISGVFGSHTKMKLPSLLLGLGSGLFYGLYSIFGRYALKKYHPFTVTFYTFVFAVIGFLFFVNPTQILNILSVSPDAIWISVLMGILCGILPYILYTTGLKYLDATVAGILAAVEPLVGNLIGLLVFHESADWGKLAGIALILASMVLLNVQAPKQRRK